MKKVILVFLFLCMLTGCTKSVGSFQEGTIKYELLFQGLFDTIKEKEWNMKLMEEQSWDNNKLEKKYHLDIHKVEESCIKSAFIEAQLNEIALFKVTKENEHYVKDAITYRLSQLENRYGKHLENAKKSLQNYKQGRIGKYYYFILGEDCKKVVNYIQDLE